MKNYFALVIDQSGSMYHLEQDIIKMVNNTINDLKTNAVKYNQETYLTLVLFAYSSRIVYSNVNIHNVPIFNKYNPNGSTALFDGVSDAISHLLDNNIDSYCVITYTDGCENSSEPNTIRNIRQLLIDKQKTDRWSFIFNLPPNESKDFCQTWKIPNDNVREWSNDKTGVENTYKAVSQGLNSYYQARSAGKKSVSNFFADLSNVKSTDLNKLSDLSRQYKVYEVTKECSIKDFVEEKTKKAYTIGTAYYQLYKKELIQSDKDLLIMEKGKKKIFGGNEARQLIGLPDSDVKVDPYNLSKYEVFPQSTSVNRKLSRGTKVIVRL